MQKSLALFLFLLLGQCIWAQSFTNFSTKNGLPSNHVYRIMQDNQGFIWILTDKGMVKYNGSEFKIFTTKDGLPSNDIWDMRITPDNKVWFFTKATKLGYILNDSVYTFNQKNKKILFPAFINQNNNTITFFDGKTLYNLENKYWNAKRINSNPKKEYKEFFIHDKLSGYTFIKEKEHLYFFDKKDSVVNNFSYLRFLSKINYRGQINDSLFCWVANDNLVLLNLNKNTTHYTPISKETSSIMRFTAVNNTIQFSGEDYLASLTSDYKLKQLIAIPNKLHSHFSFKDKSGNVWIATFNNGVYFYPKTKQTANYQLQNFKITKINTVNDKLVALVFNKGFYQYNPSNKQFQPFLNLEEYLYSAIYIDSLNSSFFVGKKYVIKLSKDSRKQILTPVRRARNILYFNQKFYKNNGAGLYITNPNSFKDEAFFQQTGISNLKAFDQKLLIATTVGLKYLDDKQINYLPIADTIFTKPIEVLAKTKKELFIGTTGFGAYVSDLKNITLLEKSDYLDVSNIYIRNNDAIYLASNQGVWLYTKKDNAYKLKRKYTIKDGLNTNQINDVFVLNDSLITASNNGISIIPLKQKGENQLLDVYFDTVLYNTKDLQEESHITYSKNNHLQVKIANIDFSENPDINYNYQLKPIQKSWTNIHSSLISFNDLAPNDYELIIEKEGYSKHFSFTIEPLWYQTFWFRVLRPVLAFLTLLSIILWFRKKELYKQQKKLADAKKLAEYELHALRSQMNPHFVFNSLNAIQYYITKNDNELSEKYLVKFARLIRMFFDFSREKEIFLTDEIKLLKGYLEIEKMRFGSDFNYIVKLINPKNIDSFKIPTMLLQPIVENAVNHGLFHNKGKGLIEISFELKNKNELDVFIKDNGVGIKKAKEIQAKSIRTKKKNNSTQVIKERIELLNQSKKWLVIYRILATEIGTSINLSFTKNE